MEIDVVLPGLAINELARLDFSIFWIIPPCDVYIFMHVIIMKI